MNKITHGKKVSLYQQMANSLKKQIRTGEYRIGKTLPPLRVLSRDFGVSLSVAQRALRHLESEGVVSAQHGKEVRLVDDAACRRAALSFGFIHPYSWDSHFENFIHSQIDQAFAKRDNFLITRSSLDNPKQERDIAEHLVDNGLQGLVLWPCSNDPNESYFLNLAKRIPVVLLDRVFPGGELPSVSLDYRTAGHDICRTLLVEKKRKRLLVISDNLHISSFDDMVQGIQDEAVAIGRAGDVTLVKFPISHIINGVVNRDWSLVDQYAPQVERLLLDDAYDAVCCMQGEFINSVMTETGITDRFSSLLYATMTSGPNHGTRKYNSLNLINWLCDFRKLLSTVAELAQDSIFHKHPVKTNVLIPIKRME